jgi:hypothetical protein
MKTFKLIGCQLQGTTTGSSNKSNELVDIFPPHFQWKKTGRSSLPISQRIVPVRETALDWMLNFIIFADITV